MWVEVELDAGRISQRAILQIQLPLDAKLNFFKLVVLQKSMIHRAKAPFRLGLAGGGTDVDPYCSQFGGAVVNATIDRYAHASILPRNDGMVVFIQENTNNRLELPATEMLEVHPDFALQIGVYNHVVAHYTGVPLSFEMVTSMDVPSGSGLGTSSTLVVAILAAFAQWLQLELERDALAQQAYVIERKELKMNGGRQDQYAAAFGGFNFIEFSKTGSVRVEPLALNANFVHDLSYYLVLFYMKSSRASSQIIAKQQENVRKGKVSAIQATHALKAFTQEVKDVLLRGDLNRFGILMHDSWENKKKLTTHISNQKIDSLYEAARSAGAVGGKISGAGGGGFMMFCCPAHTHSQVIQALQNIGGKVFPFSFVGQGVTQWSTSV